MDNRTSNKKCMTCGLVNFATETVCKRCGAALPAPGSPSYQIRTQAPPRASAPVSVDVSGFVASQINRTNKNLLVLNIIVVAVVLGSGVYFGRYLYNILLGPFEIDRATLLATTDAGNLERSFVSIQGDDALDTGMSAIRSERGRNEKVEFQYMALALDGHLLLVKNERNQDALRLSGRLVNIPSFETREILQKLFQHEPQLRGAFLPIMLDATESRVPGLIGLAVGVSLLILAAWNLKKVADRKASPGSHPLMRSLEKYGPAELVAAGIDREVRELGTLVTAGKVLVTSSWLLWPAAYSLNVRRVDELVWVYKKVTKHYTNFIPTGKTYAAIVCARTGVPLEIPTLRGEKETDRILSEIVNRAPWVIAGFSQDLQKAWKTNASAIFEAVDARRAQFQSQPSAAESA
jgi:uncharacterized protein DUF6709